MLDHAGNPEMAQLHALPGGAQGGVGGKGKQKHAMQLSRW